jgi:hypothetical protein
MELLSVSASNAVALLACGALLGMSAGCTDLFHSTDDVRTACQNDPLAAGCAAPDGDAGADAQASLCAASSDDARERAAHTCAWLGACLGPLGQNAFGTCMFQALLAYDCASNPSHRFQGALARQWACLGAAESCADVGRCVFPLGATPACGGIGGAVCDDEGKANGAASAVRIECTDAGALSEDCALWGEVCSQAGGPATCGGPPAEVCEGGAPLACDSKQIFCEADLQTLALDCTGNGAQGCAAFPPQAAMQWVACVPQSVGDSTGGASCPPESAATCNAGVASSCLAGVPEQIDCARLLGEPDAASACQSGTLSRPFDWTSPCAQSPAQCSADTCGDGGSLPASALLGCVRGAPFPLDCSAQGLGPCREVATETGSVARPACTPP